jgi:hypothetical protein
LEDEIGEVHFKFADKDDDEAVAVQPEHDGEFF